MREQAVYVSLKSEWLGNPIGSIIRMNKAMASSLFRRDAAEIIKRDTPSETKTKLQRKDRDKMVRTSINK
jgi:hypothetical protein